jgi:hypothetical protein
MCSLMAMVTTFSIATLILMTLLIDLIIVMLCQRCKTEYYVKKRLESRINPTLLLKSFGNTIKIITQLTIENY